jgi:hypothetical protein
MRILPALAPALLIAGCGGAGTSISIDAKSDDGNSLVATDANGHVTIKAPGFSGGLKLPPIRVNADNLDLNGAHLFPGSKVSDLHVNAEDKLVGKDSGEVRIAFDAPASVARVRDWFQADLAKRGWKVQADGAGLKGTSDEGDPFQLSLIDVGADKAKGTFKIGS